MVTKAPRTFEEIEAEALQLNPQARAALAGSLLDSLDDGAEHLSEEEWNRVWGEEAERRYEDYLAGRTKAIDGDEVMARARARAR
jgi:putative addiction module component (TIGR02574 family)